MSRAELFVPRCGRTSAPTASMQLSAKSCERSTSAWRSASSFGCDVARCEVPVVFLVGDAVDRATALAGASRVPRHDVESFDEWIFEVRTHARGHRARSDAGTAVVGEEHTDPTVGGGAVAGDPQVDRLPLWVVVVEWDRDPAAVDAGAEVFELDRVLQRLRHGGRGLDLFDGACRPGRRSPARSVVPSVTRGAIVGRVAGGGSPSSLDPAHATRITARTDTARRRTRTRAAYELSVTAPRQPTVIGRPGPTIGARHIDAPSCDGA